MTIPPNIPEDPYRRLGWNICIPTQLVRECRASTLERMFVDSFRVNARKQIKEMKEELSHDLRDHLPTT